METSSGDVTSSRDFPAWKSARARASILIVLAVVLVFSSFLMPQQPIYSPAFHTILAVIATTLAAVVSALAILRYYARRMKPLMFLCLGTGMLGTAALDCFHAVVAGTLWSMTATPPAVALWSWSGPRLFLSATMLVCLVVERKRSGPDARRVPDWAVFAGVTAGTLVTGLLFSLMPLPDPYVSWYGRPLEFLTGLLFVAAFVGFFRLGEWRTEPIHFWILCSLLLAAVTQCIVMSRSMQPLDGLFLWAHLLKILGYLALLIGLLIDIYQLHCAIDSAAQRLRTSEERFTLAAQGSDNGMWDWDVQSDQVWYAPRFWQLLGYEGQDYPPSVVESFSQHLHPDDYEMTWTAVRRHLSDGGTFDVEFRLMHVALGYRWYRGRAVALRDPSGKPIRMSGSIQDITESKQAERRLRESARALKRSNDELQQFAYVASHDLQEPLRAVAGYCGLLEQYYRAELDEDGRQYLRYAVEGAKRMQALIDSLLDLSRVRTHGKPFAPTGLNEVVDIVLKDLALQISESQAEIQVERLPQVMGDKTQLTQLFQNLLSNAIKFHRVEIRPKIIIEADTSRPHDWQIAIRDNGIGFEAKHTDRIFTVFQRLHTREEYSGTGIGLSICKRVVERHRGRLWTESKINQGSTFYFTLPKGLSEDESVELQCESAG